MATIVGIDPGLKGAISIVNDDGVEVVVPIPIVKSSGRGNEVMWQELHRTTKVLISKHLPDAIYIERVGARPGQGVSSMFKFGYVSGGLYALMVPYMLPITMVTPQAWKRTLKIPASKDGARLRASELFPNEAHLFTRIKDDGVAEASLIAEYGRRELTGGNHGS